MRLEILVGNEDPLIFPLNKPKIFIGSSENCDIVLNTGGVSRKHIAVVNEDENFFVIDQGSTNGSYINEERLVPGKRAEFTSFFPVRLGDNVLMTLLSDEEVPEESLSTLNIPVSDSPKSEKPTPPSSQDSTRMISLKDLKSASTEGLIKKRQATLKKKVVKPPVKKNADSDRMTKTKVMAMLLIAGAIYYKYSTEKDTKPQGPVGVIGRDIEPPVKPQEVKKLNGIKKIEKSEWISRAALPGMLRDLKCTTDGEKHLCNIIKGAQKEPWGVVQLGTSLVVMVDGSTFYTNARKTLEKAPGIASQKRDAESDVGVLAHLLFIYNAFSQEPDMELLKDHKIYFALFRSKDELISISPFYPVTLNILRGRLKSDEFKKVEQLGMRRLDHLRPYIDVY